MDGRGDLERTVPESLGGARDLVAQADSVAALLRRLADAPEVAREQVRAAYIDSREERILAQLDGVEVGSLRDVSRERLRIGALADAGLRTVGGVVRAGRAGLDRVPGIGPQTAAHLLAAAEQVASAMRQDLRFRIEMAPTDPVATRLLQTLYALGEITEVGQRYGDVVAQVLSGTARLRPEATRLTGRLPRLLTWGRRRERAERALAELADLTDRARRCGALEDAARAVDLLTSPMHPIEVWEDFGRRSARYYALLDAVEPSRLARSAAEGGLPRELLDRIERQPLDTSRLTVSLRGYQDFGARFALAQRRVIIGDEMGLGKTVQAIAVIGHHLSAGAARALVLCPASVVAGWEREIRAHSTLPVHRLQGDRLPRAAQQWHHHGGVAIMSIDAVADRLELVAQTEVLVVDEAHVVKNPHALRSRAVASIAARTPDVLLLTGTVMENRVEEFRTLVRYLDHGLADGLDPAVAVAGPDVFRRAVAPVYLRRNARDVLQELPELVQTDEWEQFGPLDGAAYRAAVQAGAFMAMRRAAFAVGRPADSAKAERLRELVEEAVENGHKVLVFSYFLEVIDLVMDALGDLAVGPLTGSVAPARRQHVIDDFATAERACALVSQIQVGGVGVNLQAASVVVLCEPALKPTTEAQAIARAHRMGQVETVQVHRLLTEDSVDEHLLRILGTKRALFDAYARRSELADATVHAVDVSEAELARRIVEAERTRLFVDPDVLSTEDAAIEDDPIGDDRTAQSER